jgi:hypothetical protein
VRLCGGMASIEFALLGPSAAQQAALDYVTRWRWPIMVGARLRRETVRGISSGLRGSCHDDIESAVLEPTIDPERVRAWWERWPEAGIVALAAGGFETVSLPMRAGRTVLDQLIEGGAWLGPVMSDDDTITLLIRPDEGQRWAALVADLGEGYAHVGRGGLVALPPGGLDTGYRVCWVVPPTSANIPHLPRFDDLADLVTPECLQQRRRRLR